MVVYVPLASLDPDRYVPICLGSVAARFQRVSRGDVVTGRANSARRPPTPPRHYQQAAQAVSMAAAGISGTRRAAGRRKRVLRWNTVTDGLDWLPDDGVVLTRTDLERIFIDLRALIRGTDEFEANRAHAVDIAVAIARLLSVTRERNDG